ncbi:MAG: HDOD domain-containing protein [candidate division Zixibacteria bacterium]|nr:HDOD domain-containing protein [candidate division KSB1 bacterium]NIR67545.1 HDOD domain-containing protein [candidate division Zixibacteria bacterium]NIS45195.1 HDOD domain-containing protein [candidate division Zixibacteria bacterium]NIT72102.1 HDOD domain-containing protein [candidate division KSB1 bacterium]NIU12973.1 HDOD domain-containing protein [candidate division Zixibacteria bacterium]
MFANPEELLERSGPMASMPEVFFKITEAIENPECSFDEIAGILGKDTALSARLLKIVNSPFYGFERKIDTIPHAITIVGMAQLKDLVFATLILDKFNGLTQRILDMKSFWRHSIACGLMARILAVFCHEKNPERYYVLGLIHDIGKLLMFLTAPQNMDEAMQRAKLEEKLLHEVEREVFGFDHAGVGGYLIRSWKLPEMFHQAVERSHDSVFDFDVSMETAILHLSDVFVHALELGNTGEVYVPPLNPVAWDKVELSASMIPLMIKQLDLEFLQATRIFL